MISRLPSKTSPRSFDRSIREMQQLPLTTSISKFGESRTTVKELLEDVAVISLLTPDIFQYNPRTHYVDWVVGRATCSAIVLVLASDQGISHSEYGLGYPTKRSYMHESPQYKNTQTTYKLL